MGNYIENIVTELDELVRQGNILYYALANEFANTQQREQFKGILEKLNTRIEDLPTFDVKYEIWYTKAIFYVKTFASDRLNDFVSLYKNEKRKQIDYLTYTISDAIVGVNVSRGGDRLAGRSAALNKVLQQVSILHSTKSLVKSNIYTLQFSIQSELFDSELVAAQELFKVGFYRAVGAMCGVLLEKHLWQVCLAHNISTKKKSPTINDLNEELKNANVIDLPTWRHLQLLGDLRNLCCHNKNCEPTKDQTNDLLVGTTKIIKTVF